MRWLSRLFWWVRHPGSMSLEWLEQYDQSACKRSQEYDGVDWMWPIQREPQSPISEEPT